jgi:hypothetical protein
LWRALKTPVGEKAIDSHVREVDRVTLFLLQSFPDRLVQKKRI